MRRLAALALFVSSGALAAVGLEVEVESRPLKDGAPQAGQERVRIEDKLLVVETGAQRVVLDFAARRKYAVDLRARTYSDSSLFPDAGFRSFEILNREMLARALEATEPGKAKDAIALAEHELSVLHPRQRSKLDVEGTGFRVGSVQVFRFEEKGSALSDADAAGLVRYLRYFKGGHPVALRALQARRVAPAELAMVSGPFQSMQSTLRVRVVPLEQAPAASLQGLRKVPAPASRMLPQDLAGAAFRIGEATFAEISRNVEGSGRRAEELIAQGKAAAGFYAALEYLLQGGPAEEIMRKHRDAFMAAPELQAVMPALNNAPDKEGAEKAIAALAAARARAGEEARILAVFEANHHLALGRAPQAAELLAGALRANPYLAGAWKDLGDLLFRQWEPGAAWTCWDAGRRIAPRFANLEAIGQFEQRLLRDLPEYF
jgi:hypothetical protein